jgi:tRNA pseudouridine55 synthase
LIICTEKQTKTIQSIQDAPKEYTGSIHIGAVTPSYDLETDPCNFMSIDGITEQQIREVAESFLGETDQIPPLFSAVKVDGKRAYKLARKGEDTVLKSRKITLTEFEITEINGPEIFFRIACSKGTYIRSIAHDFGKKLGCGAYLSSLVRTKIGDFNLINATSIQEFEEARRKRPDFC